jgi:outer membrane protein OmpA-like peptidoglycan-associated protein
VTTEYRFFGVLGDESFPLTSAFASSPPTTLKLHNQYNHSFLLGVRYAFNVAPPVPVATPAAVPAQAPARSYLVFFDWDKATLTDRARQIVKEAADNSTRVQVTRIEVNGYTDTSGTPRYNQGLSVRRAQAVANELVRDGVPKDVISIQGFGETHLLVPTGPGVREPQNRRVEIIIR